MKKKNLIILLCISLMVILFLGVWYDKELENKFKIQNDSIKDIFLVLLAIPVSILAINLGIDLVLAQE